PAQVSVGACPQRERLGRQSSVVRRLQKPRECFHRRSVLIKGELTVPQQQQPLVKLRRGAVGSAARQRLDGGDGGCVIALLLLQARQQVASAVARGLDGTLPHDVLVRGQGAFAVACAGTQFP